MSDDHSVEISLALKRAETALLAAEILFDRSLCEDALSRTYYAVLHAAKAALLAVHVEATSHEAVRRLFGLHLVQPGRVEKEFSHILREEFDDRCLADYTVDFSASPEQVRERLTDAKRFIEEMKAQVRKCSPGSGLST